MLYALFCYPSISLSSNQRISFSSNSSIISFKRLALSPISLELKDLKFNSFSKVSFLYITIDFSFFLNKGVDLFYKYSFVKIEFKDSTLSN